MSSKVVVSGEGDFPPLWLTYEAVYLISHQLCRIRQVRRLVVQDVAQQLVSAFILSRLDYCNSLLSRLPRSTIQSLQRVMNAAARVIVNLSLRDHYMKPAMKQLHWLPVEQRITYKLCLFMHHIHTGQAPQYLSYCVSAVSALSGRYRLRSTGSVGYVLPRTRTRFGERCFSYCGPAAWNTLPSDLHDITDTLVHLDKKLSYRRGTARCVVSIEILPIATQQCRNYLYDKS